VYVITRAYIQSVMRRTGIKSRADSYSLRTKWGPASICPRYQTQFIRLWTRPSFACTNSSGSNFSARLVVVAIVILAVVVVGTT